MQETMRGSSSTSWPLRRPTLDELFLRLTRSWCRSTGGLGHRCGAAAGGLGPGRINEGELRAAIGAGWRIDSLARDHFNINPALGTPPLKPGSPTPPG